MTLLKPKREFYLPAIPTYLHQRYSFGPTTVPMRPSNLFLDVTSTGNFGIRSHPHSANNRDDRETLHSVSLFCPASGIETRTFPDGRRVRICPTKAPLPRPNPRQLTQPTSCGITVNPHNRGMSCNLTRFIFFLMISVLVLLTIDGRSKITNKAYTCITDLLLVHDTSVQRIFCFAVHLSRNPKLEHPFPLSPTSPLMSSSLSLTTIGLSISTTCSFIHH